MEKPATTASKARLLLNAEPFGFGPTAAIAECFLHLRPLFQTIGYLGKGHTLDLQKPLPYDSIHDLAREESPEAVFANYDIFFTALDFEMAGKALAQGLTVIIYDPLTWYWREIPSVVKDCHLYLSQNFLGVQERLDACRQAFPAATVAVPPLVPAQPSENTEAEVAAKSSGTGTPLVLLNLGGLANPYWSDSETLDYARLVITTVARSGIATGKDLVIAGNSRIESEFMGAGARTYSKSQLQEVMQQADLALMTPGLGNIYDAARFNLPTIWLPPANDSQGQQLDLLRQAGMDDAHLDWPSFIQEADGKPLSIDYRHDQEALLQELAGLTTRVCTSEQLLENFASAMAEAASRLTDKCACADLIAKFGSGGAAHVAEEILQLARKKHP